MSPVGGGGGFAPHAALSMYTSPGSDLSEQEGAGQGTWSRGLVGPATLRGLRLQLTGGQSHSAGGLFGRQT